MLAPHVRRLLILSGASFAAFLLITAGWTLLPAVSGLDESVASGLHQHARETPVLVTVFLNVTVLGTHPFLIGLSAIVVAVLLVRRRWQLAVAWVVAQLIGLVLIEHVKLAFGRPRPAYNHVFTSEDSYSFPSGHALGSTVAFGMLAYLVAIGVVRPGTRRVGIALSVALILLIGFSRVYLGVHFLTDVLGGYALGAAWLTLAMALIEDVRAHYRSAPGQ